MFFRNKLKLILPNFCIFEEKNVTYICIAYIYMKLLCRQIYLLYLQFCLWNEISKPYRGLSRLKILQPICTGVSYCLCLLSHYFRHFHLLQMRTQPKNVVKCPGKKGLRQSGKFPFHVFCCGCGNCTYTFS